MIPEMTFGAALDFRLSKVEGTLRGELIVNSEKRKVNSAVVYRLEMQGLRRQSLVHQDPLGWIWVEHEKHHG